MKIKSLSILALFAATFLITGCGSSERQFKGLELSGEDDFVEFNFSPGFTANNNFTFEAWVKVLSNITHSTVILGPAKTNFGAYGLYTFHEGKLSFGVRTKDNHAIIETPDFILNQWHHIAGVFNGSDSKVYFYLDGELVATKVLMDGDMALSQNNLLINGIEALRGEGVKRGRSQFIISDARIWNIVRNQEKIKEDMHKTLTGKEAGLIAYWPFNEMKGTVANDLTKNQNHGIIHGGKWHKGK